VVSPELLKILACPDCKTPVVMEGAALICGNGQCRRRYRIDDDIPVMLIEESEVLTPDAWRQTGAAKPQPAA